MRYLILAKRSGSANRMPDMGGAQGKISIL
jgi:hypothetical protein